MSKDLNERTVKKIAQAVFQKFQLKVPKKHKVFKFYKKSVQL